ncbi:MAG: protoporphyrinogen oxidase [Thermogutta sp.]|nr:protoporphyrinogen oxidase [Thermogutta sp.]
MNAAPDRTPPETPPRRYAVVGCGISGLSAALELHETAGPCLVEVFDAAPEPGGVLGTVSEDGFQVERSADNFITTLPWGVELCRKLGLAGALVTPNPDARRAFVVHRGKLRPLPDGFQMLAPTRWLPLALTPLLSPAGKIRAAAEYFLPPRRDDGDESLADFARRRLGNEVYQRLVEPLVSAVYGADTEKLSLLATLSRFREMEKGYGSLIRAMRARTAERRKTARAAAGSAKTIRESGARYGMFVTLRHGFRQLLDAIVARLPPGTLHLSTRVESAAPWEGKWRLTFAGGGEMLFDGVVLAVPAHAAADLTRRFLPDLSAKLAQIDYTGSAILAAAYRREDVGHPLDGSGCVVPAVEKSPVLAISFSSRKYPHTAPPGMVLLRIFAGGARRPDLVDMDDARLRASLLPEVERLLAIHGPPLKTWLFRWRAAMPQYAVGHLDLLREIRRELALHAGLGLAGNGYFGVGTPHCIHSGQLAAAWVTGQARPDDFAPSPAF